MESIFDMIRENRPNISDNSIKTYVSNLKKVGISTAAHILSLIKYEEIFNFIKDLKPTSQRNILSAILVLIKATDVGENWHADEVYQIYKDKLTEVNNEYQATLDKNQKTPTQAKNWSSMAELKKITKKLLKNGVNQNSLVAALYSLQVCCRLDYYNMQIVNSKHELEDKQNYLIIYNRSKKVFVFKDYKTANKYNELRIPVSKELNTVLNKFLKLNPERKYLLQKRNGEPISRNALGKMIPVVFADTGKLISLNIIRHMVVSESIDINKIKADKKLADNMMHSSELQLEYAKT